MSSPRVIAGKARGIRLQDVPGDITRPITDMVKGALFNILGTETEGTSWLDLFGGTGAVGIEALSRGASFVRFVDLNRPAINTIRANLEKTKFLEAAEVLQSDSFTLLNRRPDRTFDFIFVAPPQYKDMWVQAMQSLDHNPGWLQPDTWVIVQIDPIEYHPLTLINLNEFEQRKYGNTLLVFYERLAEKNTSI